MNVIEFPPGYRLEKLRHDHPRASFACGEPAIDNWLSTKAWQNQEKRLSATKVLLSSDRRIAGFYTLTTKHVNFAELPPELIHHLPRRELPVALLAWFGMDADFQGRGLGGRLLAAALTDVLDAARIVGFIAVLVDCISDEAKAFYQHYRFRELPGHPSRLYLGGEWLEALMTGQ